MPSGTETKKEATRMATPKTDHAAVKDFMVHNYRHFNAAVVIDASKA